MDAKKHALRCLACCGRYLEGVETAPNAQALMRSRYSAFVFENAAYLLATWHASRRPVTLDFEQGAKWLGLQVQKFELKDAEHAEVTFVARQRDRSGRAIRLHERSRFVCEDGCWYYIDGDRL